MKAINALHDAQRISFSPFVFQTAFTLLELGVLEVMINADQGLSINNISSETGVSNYGVSVLIEMAEVAGIVELLENGNYKLTKTGYFLARDEMTRVNLMFTQKVCYQGLYSLKESIETGSPAGLSVFGDWKTVYQGLSELPQDVKKAWFDFDHFYSDNSFEEALKVIFKNSPKVIFDIGGNTGKWAIASTNFNENVRVSIFDLPGQLKVAKANIEAID